MQALNQHKGIDMTYTMQHENGNKLIIKEEVIKGKKVNCAYFSGTMFGIERMEYFVEASENAWQLFSKAVKAGYQPAAA